MKKKFFLLGLCMLLICTAFTALAEYQAGDVVTITVSVSNANEVCAFEIGLDYDRSAFEFTGAEGQNGAFGGKNGFAYASMSPFGNGTVGTVTFRVKDTAVPGKTYIISAHCADACDIDEKDVNMGVSTSGGTVTVVAEECDHAYVEKVDVPASCEQPGKSTFTCTKCGDSYTKDLPATGHEYDAGKITKEPTCKDEGEKMFTCTVCNATKTEKVPKIDQHTWDDGVITKPATCLTDGEKTTTCTVCGKTDVTAVKSPGHHTPGENTRVDKEPTCTEDGKGSYQCAACGEWIDNGVIPATGHDLKETVTAATCGKDGQTVSACTKCDFSETTVIPATGLHTYDEGTVTTQPTCLDKGEKTITCSVCGDTRKEEIPATGHRPGSDLKQQDPTCTKPGYKYFTCTVCGTEVKEDTIPATGVHIYKVTEETPATCTADGKRVSTCTYECGEIKTETLKALGHKLSDWTVTTAPTCTENGEQTRVCENGCGKAETKSVKALGHDWNAWVITKPATDKESGEQQRTCKRCGKVETQKIDNRVNYAMTVCSEGIRFRDLENPITKDWYMFTPIDLSVEGTQTFDLIAGNIHRIGKVSVLVQDGKVTVTCKINNRRDIYMYDEFMTILPSLADVTELDFKQMTNYPYGEPISIEEVLGGDTKVLLLLRNRATYMEGTKGVAFFDGRGKTYNALVESLKNLMD